MVTWDQATPFHFKERGSDPMAGVIQRVSRLRWVFVFRFILGLVFLYASLGKILDPKALAEDLLEYRILTSPQIVKYLAVTLPWVEWFCGTFLLLGIFVRSVSILATGLLAVFVAAMVSAMARGLEINCGCFGTPHEVIGPFTLFRDSLFLGMSLTVALSKVDPFTLESFIANRNQRSGHEQKFSGG